MITCFHFISPGGSPDDGAGAGGAGPDPGQQAGAAAHGLHPAAEMGRHRRGPATVNILHPPSLYLVFAHYIFKRTECSSLRPLETSVKIYYRMSKKARSKYMVHSLMETDKASWKYSSV